MPHAHDLHDIRLYDFPYYPRDRRERQFASGYALHATDDQAQRIALGAQQFKARDHSLLIRVVDEHGVLSLTNNGVTKRRSAADEAASFRLCLFTHHDALANPVTLEFSHQGEHAEEHAARTIVGHWLVADVDEIEGDALLHPFIGAVQRVGGVPESSIELGGDDDVAFPQLRDDRAGDVALIERHGTGDDVLDDEA